jgi:hypothetical protein
MTYLSRNVGNWLQVTITLENWAHCAHIRLTFISLFIKTTDIILISKGTFFMLFHPPKNPVELKVMHLNKTQAQRREDLMEATQGKAALKQLKKSMAKKAKKDSKAKNKGKNKDKQQSQQVFVLDFDGDMKASAVKHLREEISTLISTANKGDEVVVRL